jgi:hypothetical protein
MIGSSRSIVQKICYPILTVTYYGIQARANFLDNPVQQKKVTPAKAGFQFLKSGNQ